MDRTEEFKKDFKYEGYIDGVAEAIEEVQYRLAMYSNATNRMNAAHHLVELDNAVGDLLTWHKGYDYNIGTLPWEREFTLG